MPTCPMISKQGRVEVKAPYDSDGDNQKAEVDVELHAKKPAESLG